MNRLAKLVLAVCVPLLLIASVPASASTPSSGTLSKTKKTVTWSGSFTLSEPLAITGCAIPEGDPLCDDFKLKIDLGEGAKIRVSLPVEATEDLDFSVYAPNGAMVADSGNAPGTNESADFVHHARFRKQYYTVEVKPFVVIPGQTYKATAKAITLGAK